MWPESDRFKVTPSNPAVFTNHELSRTRKLLSGFSNSLPAGGRVHNPHVGDGKQAVIDHFERMAAQHHVKRVTSFGLSRRTTSPCCNAGAGPTRNDHLG